MPMVLAAANSLVANRLCISGSPPLSVKPPPLVLRPCRYFPSSSAAFVTDTGRPLVIVQVSGLWQYWQRHMQPVVQATTRTPGPSTVAPVVKECRNPMSPVDRALLTSESETVLPRLTRRSNGLLPTNGVWLTGRVSDIANSSMVDGCVAQ